MNQDNKIDILEQLTEIQAKQLQNLQKRLKHQENLMRRTAIFMLILFVAVFVLYYKLFIQ